VLSINLPSFAAGMISSICIIVGVLHSILDIYKNIIGVDDKERTIQD